MFELGLMIVALVVFYFVGKSQEQKHYNLIEQREKTFAGKPTYSTKRLPSHLTAVESKIVCGSVVISVDYFKNFMARLRLFFGGELKAFSPLIDRARREAILRMKESYPDADLFLNLRLETSSISQGAHNTLGTVEVLAYATAIKLADGQK